MFTKLKNIRKENRISVKSMANMLKLKSPSSYWKKENGDVSFSLNEAKKISIFFRKTIDEIFF